MARQAKSPSKSKKPKADDPLLTQENFEKELQALAAKAQEETWSKWAVEQLQVLFQSAALLSLAAVYSNVSQLVLSPVYGSIPASIYHSRGVMTACFVGWSSNLFLQRNLPVKPRKLLPLIAAYMPLVQYFLFQLSGTLGARYGPVITEVFTFYPLLVLSVACTATVMEGLEVNLRWKWLSDAAPGVGSFAFYKTAEYVSNKVIQSNIGSSVLFTRLGLQILLAGLYPILAPSKLLLFIIPAIAHTVFLNTHLQLPYPTSSLNATMASYGWSILDRRESITGYISVLDSPVNKFRLLRCDHSLLGGEWAAASISIVKEPVYAIFAMLEAVRLIQTPVKVPDAEAQALVIGLGVGTTPSALIAHGINTTIVEIDPVVHEFATKYFDLPPKHTAVIEDAVTYASETAQTSRKFNYIIHDVFTGGAEPVDLFTFEFLQDLKAMLTPQGVIAINYAGDLLLPPAQITIHTIKAIFPSCRLFRESARPSAEVIAAENKDFTNVVIFCTNSGWDVVFRESTEKDFLGSMARRNFLKPTLELEEDDLAGEEYAHVLYRNETEKFKNWQEESALGHWAVMRTVISPFVWNNW
ncbi:S-adenosyl-L-methionine-dependent methyltransferase [Xylogone sp. PMI_703]|nr:S-adenosyl-L-methionine-dependent methyltransferase [Xylogone sp. PMI_703]